MLKPCSSLAQKGLHRAAACLVGAALLAVALAPSGCGGRRDLPDDPNLETFIKASSECVFVDRAFSQEPDLLRQEMAEVEFPADWKRLVDSLLAAYGTEPAFWYDVYSRIVEQSRS